MVGEVDTGAHRAYGEETGETGHCAKQQGLEENGLSSAEYFVGALVGQSEKSSGRVQKSVRDRSRRMGRGQAGEIRNLSVVSRVWPRQLFWGMKCAVDGVLHRGSLSDTGGAGRAI